MFYVFLDIDGVLNTSSQWKTSYSLNDTCIDNLYQYLYDLSKHDLSKIQIILISSWRDGFSKDGNNLPQINVLNQKLLQYGLQIYDKTYKSPMNDRQREIEQYIIKNHIDEADCIIIDDDISLYKDINRFKYICPDPNLGFQYQKKRRKN